MNTRLGAPRDPSHLRESNKSLVRNVFRRDGPLTRTDVARISGLTKPTVSAIVRELLADGTIVESDQVRPAASGARPTVYEYNSFSRLFAGVHIGVNTTDVMIADGLGARIAVETFPTPHQAAHTALERAREVLRGLLTSRRLHHDRLAAVGVCVPGMVDTDTGRCLLAPNLGWRGIDVAAYFRELTPAVVVHNVIHAALEAEHLEGAAVGVGDAVLLFEDNGVGAALMARGSIYSGAYGLAGELGHCKLRGATEVCACGGVGCLETQVSAQAVLRRAGGLLPAGTEPAGVFAALAASDRPGATELLRTIGRELGEAAAWVVNITNPRLLLLGGTFAAGGEELAAGVWETFGTAALPELRHQLELRRSTLPVAGAVRGALLLARRRADESEQVA